MRALDVRHILGQEVFEIIISKSKTSIRLYGVLKNSMLPLTETKFFQYSLFMKQFHTGIIKK